MRKVIEWLLFLLLIVALGLNIFFIFFPPVKDKEIIEITVPSTYEIVTESNKDNKPAEYDAEFSFVCISEDTPESVAVAQMARAQAM